MRWLVYGSILLLLVLMLCACSSSRPEPKNIPTLVPIYTDAWPTPVPLLDARTQPDCERPALSLPVVESWEQGIQDAPDNGAYIVDLIAAWVEAGVPESAPFGYPGLDGNVYQTQFPCSILPWFTQANFWFQGAPSCTSCHHAGLTASFQALDLASYAGILAGAERLSMPPGRPILGESQVGATDYDWSRSVLRARLRNNRMPPGMPFDISGANRDGPTVQVGEMVFTAVDLIGAWVREETFVDAQATFQEHVLPLFTEAGVWYEDAPACTSCHHAEPETSLREMDLSSYEGVMAGARRRSEYPGVPLLGESEIGASDYDWTNAILRDRLRNNRMPPGMPFDVAENERDGPSPR